MHSRELLDQAFDLILDAALKGERCPQNDPFGPLKTGATSVLARTGRIRIDISSKNWRTVTILTGPHAGNHTQRDPTGSKPWKTITTETVINGSTKDYGASKRTAPSPPRTLTSAQIK